MLYFGCITMLYTASDSVSRHLRCSARPLPSMHWPGELVTRARV